MFKNVIKYILHRILYPNSRVAASASVKDCTIANKVFIGQKSIVNSSSIKTRSYINSSSVVNNAFIGAYTSIGSNVKIGLGSHPTSLFSTHPIFYSEKASISFMFKGVPTNKFKASYTEFPRTIIGSDVWIGDNAIVIGGVEIGHGSVIAAGSVVTKKVEPYSVVGGVPAKVIKYRFNDKTIRYLLETSWWEIEEKYLFRLNNQPDQLDEIIKEIKKIREGYL